MEPLISPGDKLYIEKNERKIYIGDILILTQKKRLLAHRVVKILEGRIVTKGDNMIYPDQPFDKKYIIGKVVQIIGKHGVINLRSMPYKLINLYFISISLIIFYSPFMLKYRLNRLFRGYKIFNKIKIFL
jgi:signal peptidase I